jgi:vitamin B12 transporter
MGLRHDTHETFGGHTTFRLAASSLEPASRILFRASLGTGWKTPTLYQLYSSFGTPSLRPEENRAWDAGVERKWRRNHIRLSVSYFENSFRDFLDFDNIAFVYLNVPKAKTRGAETELSVNPLHLVTFRWAFTHTIALNSDTGELLLRRPSYQHSVAMEIMPMHGLRTELDALFTGTRMDVVFPPWPEDAYNIPLSLYSLWSFRVSYSANTNFRFFSRCENLFNRRYEEVRGFATAGRTLFVGTQVTM